MDNNKIILAIAMGIAIVFGYLGAKIAHPKDNIQIAEHFFLNDQQGRLRGSFSCGLSGSPELRMTDQNGKTRVSFNVNGYDSGGIEHPKIIMYDSKGVPRSILGITDIQATEGDKTTTVPQGSLIFYNENGQAVRALPK